MDTKQLKILQELNKTGAGHPVDISPLLLTMFPDVKRTDEFEVRWAAGIIHKLLEDMKSEGWIDVPRYISLGTGNSTGGYTWLDWVHINATINNKGIEVLEKEMNKTDNDKLTDSILETNESNRETNKATAKNMHFQRKATRVTIIIAVLTTLFILITIWQQYRNKTEEKLEGIQIQEQKTRTIMQDIRTSLQEIRDAIQKPKHDTVYVKTIKR